MNPPILGRLFYHVGDRTPPRMELCLIKSHLDGLPGTGFWDGLTRNPNTQHAVFLLSDACGGCDGPCIDILWWHPLGIPIGVSAEDRGYMTQASP